MKTSTVYVLVMFSALFWGANFNLAGPVMAGEPPLWAAALRFLIGAAIIFNQPASVPIVHFFAPPFLEAISYRCYYRISTYKDEINLKITVNNQEIEQLLTFKLFSAILNLLSEQGGQSEKITVAWCFSSSVVFRAYRRRKHQISCLFSVIFIIQ